MSLLRHRESVSYLFNKIRGRARLQRVPVIKQNEAKANRAPISSCILSSTERFPYVGDSVSR